MTDGAVARTGSGILRDRFWLVPLLLFPLLAFPNLGDAYLWQDEGETAVLAQCVLLHGYPLAHDGRQVISDQYDRSDLKNGVWIWSAWLPIYSAAAAFAVLGESTLAARLPFALSAWLAVLLAYVLFQELTRNRRLSRFACILLTLSVPLLVHSRQCRYYSLLLLFTIVHLLGYARVLRGARYGTALIAFGGAGLAQSFLPQLLASSAACGVHALWLVRDRLALRRFLTGSAVAAAVSLPFFVYTAAWSRDYRGAGHGYDSAARFMANLRAYLLMAHAYGFPFFLAVPVVWLGARGMLARVGLSALALAGFLGLALVPGPSSFALTWLAAGVAAGLGALALFRLRRTDGAAPDWRALTGLVLAVTVLASAAHCQFPFYRYLIGVLPLFALWTAYTATRLVRGSLAGMVALGAVLAVTNVISHAPFVWFARMQGPVGPQRSAWVDETLAYGFWPSHLPGLKISRFLPNQQPWSLSPLRDYVGEITHEYVGPVKAVVRKIAESESPGRVLVTTYEHFSFQFHTDLLVLTHEEQPEGADPPDWLFFHGERVRPPSPEEAAALDTIFERVPLAGKEFFWENIPEPHLHLYRTPATGPDLLLLRRRDGATP